MRQLVLSWFGYRSLRNATARRRAQQKTWRPQFEALEDRAVPALLGGGFGLGVGGVGGGLPGAGSAGGGHHGHHNGGGGVGGTGGDVCDNIVPGHVVDQNGQNTGKNGGAEALNIHYLINGHATTDLGLVQQGDTVTVIFDTAANAATTEFSLVAYVAANGTFDDHNINGQQEWADTTGTFTGAGTHSLTVKVPNGFFQLDFVAGAAITCFHEGERYSAEGRLIAGTTGGDHVVGTTTLHANASAVHSSAKAHHAVAPPHQTPHAAAVGHIFADHFQGDPIPLSM